jgi:FkbM family methyltransferase
VKLGPVIKLLTAGMVLANVLYFVPSTRLFCLYAMGRASRCPLTQAIHSFDTLSRRVDIERRLDHSKRLLEKDPAGYHLWETTMGRYWVPERNDDSLTDNLSEQATKVYGSAENGVQRGDVVLDCGANVGVFVREALADGAKLVVAIEPAPENVECLRRNFVAETANGTVVIVPQGVWDRDDVLIMHIDASNSARNSVVGRFGPALAEVKVPLTTIDKLVAQLKLEKVDFIKMDIEGAESAALAGAKDTLNKHHPRMAIAMEHLESDPVRIPQIVYAEAPSYQIKCGDCIDQITRVRPDVLFFR